MRTTVVTDEDDFAGREHPGLAVGSRAQGGFSWWERSLIYQTS